RAQARAPVGREHDADALPEAVLAEVGAPGHGGDRDVRGRVGAEAEQLAVVLVDERAQVAVLEAVGLEHLDAGGREAPGPAREPGGARVKGSLSPRMRARSSRRCRWSSRRKIAAEPSGCL